MTTTETEVKSAAIDAAETWVEAKADEKAAQKVLDAAKARRKAAADTLMVLGFQHGDTVTVYGNRRMEFTVQERTTQPYKAALDAVRPLLDDTQESVVQAQLDAGKSVSIITGLRNAK